MNTDSKNPSSSQSDVLPTSRLFDDWIDPIESGVRARVRDWIEALVHSELDAALQRPRYGRSTGGETEPAVAPVRGYRNGSRTRTLTGTFGRTDITVPRARLQGEDGATTEWKSKALRAYQRRTKAADALIASAYLSGTNTRRVRRALAALFGGAVGKDTVSRVWRKVQTDWDAWNARPLKDEPIVRLILDGTVVRVRLDKKATAISLLVVIGVREDGQKVLLAVKRMGGETTDAWRAVLDDLTSRGLRRPQFVIVDGGAGLACALAAVWNDVPVQRCTARRSSANGGCATKPLQTASRKPEMRCSHSPRCHHRSGRAREQQTPLNVRSSWRMTTPGYRCCSSGRAARRSSSPSRRRSRTSATLSAETRRRPRKIARRGDRGRPRCPIEEG